MKSATVIVVLGKLIPSKSWPETFFFATEAWNLFLPSLIRQPLFYAFTICQRFPSEHHSTPDFTEPAGNHRISKRTASSLPPPGRLRDIHIIPERDLGLGCQKKGGYTYPYIK